MAIRSIHLSYRGVEMRKLLAAGVALAGLSGCASMNMDMVSTDQELSRVYEVKAGKDQIYSASRQWIAESFKSSKSVVEYEDKAEGTIIGNGSIPYPCADKGSWVCVNQSQVLKLLFTMRLEAKDGKFRLGFSNVQVSSVNGAWSQMLRVDYQSARVDLLQMGDRIAARIEAQDKKSDW